MLANHINQVIRFVAQRKYDYGAIRALGHRKQTALYVDMTRSYENISAYFIYSALAEQCIIIRYLVPMALKVK